MSESTPILNMPYILPSQAQKHATHNETIQQLDAIVQLSVIAFDATTPPGASEPGHRYSLSTNATGNWAGQGNKIALWANNTWQFIQPLEGWRAWGETESELRVFQAGAWVTPPVSELGVNTSADATNRLAVAADAALFTHNGNGHQLKINKASTGDTASVVFQSNWTGHAEMGLAGNTDWSIKVSPDGSNWTEALSINPTDGRVSGAAIQTNPTDISEGRLMRADFGYGPGNLVGSVSQAGGAPTGAVIESGTNSNGDYIRFADGTQICWAEILMVYSASSNLSGFWTFPAEFSTLPVPQGAVNTSDLLTNSTPAPDSVLGIGFIGNSTTTVQPNLYRLAGATNFGTSDTCKTFIQANGRWF